MSAERDMYERTYAAGDARFAEWRALSARAKADHVMALCAAIGLRPRRVLEVGCGDGALLHELSRRHFGAELAGYDVASSAIDALNAREIPGLVDSGTFDGRELPLEDSSFDVALLSHVLEHVPVPGQALADAARVSSAVLVEVPLEANVSAGRSAAEEIRGEIGHVQRFDRAAIRELVSGAGLEVRAELTDPLTREVHLFHASSGAQRARALAKAAVRRSAFRASKRLAERLFTVHYACVCEPATRRRAPGSPRGPS